MCLNGRPWGAISAPMKSIPYRGPITDCGSSGEGDKEATPLVPTSGVAYDRCYRGLDSLGYLVIIIFYYWIVLIIIFYFGYCLLLFFIIGIVLIIIFVLLDSGNYYFYYWIVAHRGAYSVI